MGVSGWNFADSPELAEAKRERDEARAAAAASTRTSAAVAAVVESSASSSAATDADAPVRAGRFLVLNPDPMEPAAGDAQQEVLSSLENANLIVVPSPRVIPPLVADTAPSPSGANTPATSTEVALSAEAPAEDKEVTAEGRPPSTLSVSVPPPPPLGRTSAPPPSSTKMASAGDADGLKRVSRGRFEVVDIPVESTTPGGSRRGFLSDAAGQVLPTAASMQSISSDGNTPLSSGVSLAALDGIVVRSSAVRSPLRPPQPPVRPRSPRSGSAQPNRGVDQATGAAAAAAAAAVATGATVPRHLQGAFAASRPLTTTSPSAVPEAGVHTAPAATTLHYSRQARSQNFPLAHASEEDLLVVMHHVAGLQRTLAALLPSDWNDGPSGSRTGPSPHASRLSGAESWYGAVPMSGAEPSSSNWSPRGDPPNNHHQHSAHASGATVVASTTTSPDQRSEEVGQLRQEMSMMRAENDQLRAELEALRTDLSGIKQQLVHWAASAAQAVPSQTRSRSADPAPVVPRSPGTSLHRSPPPPPPPPPR
ncbi:hypothetical protein CDCA_CDCA08G2311 [Cyanidium caldarium]|uniref:Uncharacterized protein n=1 Tax=Cyanidium caldarium TaxID=2771 RepID=A0AAV9IVU8_CYACA|nr:hypothetical protein CDCA_CDCA08G2311 [Cyanidium caldarium]